LFYHAQPDQLFNVAKRCSRGCFRQFHPLFAG
jgi:hypothetical protein